MPTTASTSFPASLSNYSGGYVWWFSIEGVGPHLSVGQLTAAGDDGSYRFCSDVPAFGEGNAAGLWRPILHDYPDALAQRMKELGGVAELGAVSFAVVDIDDIVTQAVATESPPVAVLSAAMTDSSTTMTVQGSTAIAADTPLYVGEEAMYLDSAPAASMTVRRGAMGTVAEAHAVGDPVYQVTPFLLGRRVEFYIAPASASGYDGRELVSTYTIESIQWSQDLNVWTLNCRSELDAFDQISPALPRMAKATDEFATAMADAALGEAPLTNLGDTLEWMYPQWASANAPMYIAVGDEVMAGTYSPAIRRWTTYARGVCESSVEDPRKGDAIRQVMTSSIITSSFQFSPGPSPSTSRLSGTWTETRHPLEILLCILLSSREIGDGFEGTNFEAGENNYSSLIPGFGMGIDASFINWDSWRDMISRTSQFNFPNIVFGREDQPLREWVDENILRPLNVTIVMQAGQLHCVRPRLPLAGEAAVSVGTSSVLLDSGGAGDSRLPDMQVSMTLQVPSQFGFSQGPGAQSLGIAEAATNGPSGSSVLIPVPGASTAQASFWAAEAAARLREVHRPKLRVHASVLLTSETWGLLVGEFFNFTMPEVPTLKGQRDINGAAFLREKELRITAEGPYLALVLDVYATEQQEAYRIAPAAKVSSVSGNVATVESNRYTDAAATGGLPTTDAAAFLVGYTVQLRSAAGNPFAGVQDVTAVSGDDITLDGNFSGSLAAGTVLTIAPHGDAGSEERERYAFTADINLLVKGLAPYVYGDL